MAERIHKLEFVDMAEILPEYWGSVQKVRSETQLTHGVPQSVAKRNMTDILTWVQCFAVYTSGGFQAFRNCTQAVGLPHIHLTN